MEATDTIRDNPAERRFELATGDDVAIAEYELTGGVMTFTHTFVPESLRGRGIATRLVKAGLDAARDRELRVVPQCSTFAGYMKTRPETHDLLTADARAALDA